MTDPGSAEVSPAGQGHARASRPRSQEAAFLCHPIRVSIDDTSVPKIREWQTAMRTFKVGKQMKLNIARFNITCLLPAHNEVVGVCKLPNVAPSPMPYGLTCAEREVLAKPPANRSPSFSYEPSSLVKLSLVSPVSHRPVRVVYREAAVCPKCMHQDTSVHALGNAGGAMNKAVQPWTERRKGHLALSLARLSRAVNGSASRSVWMDDSPFLDVC